MCDNAIANVAIVLQEFHCEKSDGNGLTLNSLEMLLSECPRLKAVSDIQAWSAIEPAEVNLKSYGALSDSDYNIWFQLGRLTFHN